MGRGGPTYKSVSVLSTHIALLKLRSFTIDCSSCKIREIIKSHCQHLHYISALSSIKKETFEQSLLCQWLGHSKHSVAFQNDLNLLHCTISKLVPLCTFYQFLDLFIGSYKGRLCQGSRDWSNVNILQETRRRQKTWPPYCIFKSGIQSRQILMQIKQRWLCCHFPRINVLFIVIYCFACFDFKFKMKDLRYSEVDHHKQCNQIFTVPRFLSNNKQSKREG